MHNRRVVVSGLGILESYHSQGQPRSLHTNDVSAQSDWPSLAQPMGMSGTSVGFLGGCSVAMRNHLDFQNSHSTCAQLQCWHL